MFLYLSTFHENALYRFEMENVILIFHNFQLTELKLNKLTHLPLQKKSTLFCCFHIAGTCTIHSQYFIDKHI